MKNTCRSCQFNEFINPDDDISWGHRYPMQLYLIEDDKNGELENARSWQGFLKSTLIWIGVESFQSSNKALRNHQQKPYLYA